jgi:hypothetical protein
LLWNPRLLKNGVSAYLVPEKFQYLKISQK